MQLLVCLKLIMKVKYNFRTSNVEGLFLVEDTVNTLSLVWNKTSILLSHGMREH